jgi:hypothetical protein
MVTHFGLHYPQTPYQTSRFSNSILNIESSCLICHFQEQICRRILKSKTRSELADSVINQMSEDSPYKQANPLSDKK